MNKKYLVKHSFIGNHSFSRQKWIRTWSSSNNCVLFPRRSVSGKAAKRRAIVRQLPIPVKNSRDDLGKRRIDSGSWSQKPQFTVTWPGCSGPIGGRISWGVGKHSKTTLFISQWPGKKGGKNQGVFPVN